MRQLRGCLAEGGGAGRDAWVAPANAEMAVGAALLFLAGAGLQGVFGVRQLGWNRGRST